MDAISLMEINERVSQRLTENPDRYRVQPLSDEEKMENIALLSGGISGLIDPDWTTPYSEIKSDLKTGDIVLVHGRYPYSWVVTLLQWFNNWGHAAIVIRRADIDPENEFGFKDELLLWESNVKDGDVPNLWRGPCQNQVKEGPMLISLERRLEYSQKNYKDVKIAIRRLEAPKLDFDFKKLHAVFDEYIKSGFPDNKEILYSIYLGRKYNRSSEDPLHAISLYIDFDSGHIEELSIDREKIMELSSMDVPKKKKMYCTELMAATLRKMGLLNTHHVSNAYSPRDFSRDGSVRFLKRGWLGGEIFINMLK